MTMQEVQSFHFAKWLDDGDIGTSPAHLSPGEFFEGTVMEYNADSGGKDFNEQVCGIITIRLHDDESTIVKVTLDKGRLKTAFSNLSTRYMAKEGSFLGAFVRIQYDGWQEPTTATGRKYKGFQVKHDPEKFDPVNVATSNLQDAF